MRNRGGGGAHRRRVSGPISALRGLESREDASVRLQAARRCFCAAWPGSWCGGAAWPWRRGALLRAEQLGGGGWGLGCAAGWDGGRRGSRVPIKGTPGLSACGSGAGLAGDLGRRSRRGVTRARRKELGRGWRRQVGHACQPEGARSR